MFKNIKRLVVHLCMKHPLWDVINALIIVLTRIKIYAIMYLCHLNSCEILFWCKRLTKLSVSFPDLSWCCRQERRRRNFRRSNNMKAVTLGKYDMNSATQEELNLTWQKLVFFPTFKCSETAHKQPNKITTASDKLCHDVQNKHSYFAVPFPLSDFTPCTELSPLTSSSPNTMHPAVAPS